jgi:hypothetical protein
MRFVAVVSAFALVVGCVPAIACSLRHSPLVLDAAGNAIQPAAPVRRYEFEAVVLGMTEETAPPRLPGWSATKVSALRLRVLKVANGALSLGSEYSIYYAGIGSDCLPKAVSVPASWFPVGSAVSVSTDNLISGSIERTDRKP